MQTSSSPQKEHGHTPINHETLEALLKWPGPPRAKDVLLAVCRETWGWSQRARQISTDRLAELLGVSTRQARNLRKLAIECGLIVETEDGLMPQKDPSLWTVKRTKKMAPETVATLRKAEHGCSEKAEHGCSDEEAETAHGCSAPPASLAEYPASAKTEYPYSAQDVKARKQERLTPSVTPPTPPRRLVLPRDAPRLDDRSNGGGLNGDGHLADIRWVDDDGLPANVGGELQAANLDGLAEVVRMATDDRSWSQRQRDDLALTLRQAANDPATDITLADILELMHEKELAPPMTDRRLPERYVLKLVKAKQERDRKAAISSAMSDEDRKREERERKSEELIVGSIVEQALGLLRRVNPEHRLAHIEAMRAEHRDSRIEAIRKAAEREGLLSGCAVTA